jgi:uncharacterized protein (TIGR02266 family)
MREGVRARRADCGSFIIDRRGTILGFDEGLEQLTGWPALEVIGQRHGSAQEQGAAELPPLVAGAIPPVDELATLDLTLNARDNRSLHVEALARRLPGPGERVLVTVLRVLARSAGISASRPCDPLTGMPDRTSFEHQLAEDARSAQLGARPLALILAEIDHLREVADRVGREARDEVLTRVAGILRASVLDDSRVFRVGDERFAVILPDAGRGEARQVAAGLRSTVERHRKFPAELEQRQLRITLSLGAASLPTDAETAEDLEERATEALDEARSMGRNRVWCYVRRPRVPLQVPVFFDGEEALLVGYTRDLSPSGIFVQTSAPIAIGMRCAFTFPLPGNEDPIHVIGRVVRTVPPEVDAAEARIPGMGVEFERFGRSRDRRAIDTFVHGLEPLSERPEGLRFSVES